MVSLGLLRLLLGAQERRNARQQALALLALLALLARVYLAWQGVPAYYYWGAALATPNSWGAGQSASFSFFV